MSLKIDYQCKCGNTVFVFKPIAKQYFLLDMVCTVCNQIVETVPKDIGFGREWWMNRIFRIENDRPVVVGESTFDSVSGVIHQD